MVNNFHRCIRATLSLGVLLILILAPPAIWAAGTIVTNPDRNLMIRVQDALPGDQRTRLLYYTVPGISQEHVREECTANFYLLDLQPGLSDVKPQILAENFCGYFGMSGALLANGDALIIAGDRVEVWRLGEGKVREWNFSAVDSLHGYWKEINDGGTPLDVARNGDVVLAKPLPRGRKDVETPSGIVAGLSADGGTRWQLILKEPAVLLTLMNVWATGDGGAWLHAAARPLSGTHLPGTEAPPGAIVTNQNRLYRISATGELSAATTVASTTMVDFANPVPLPDASKDPAGFQAALQRQLALSNPESIRQLAAYPHADGSADILIHRLSNDESRKGSALYRVASDGKVTMQVSLEKAIAGEGLRNWVDFLADDSQVMLYGALGTRENRLSQGFLCRIDIPNGRAKTRLAPLDDLGLEAAKKAADEQVQSLEHYPGQEPVLLTRLGGKPLMVSLIKRSRRPAMQLDEGTEQLAIYTEARD